MIKSFIISIALLAPLSAYGETFVSLAVDSGAMVHGFGVSADVVEAQIQALRACSELAGDCRVGYTRSDTCVGFAADFSAGTWGANRAATSEEAAANALNHCIDNYNSGELCQLVEVRCTANLTESN